MIDEQKLREEIGARIRKSRLSRGLTQAELAEKSGLSTKYITLAETNKVNASLSAIISIANALDESVSYIFGTDERDTDDSRNAFGNFMKLPKKQRDAVKALIDGLQ